MMLSDIWPRSLQLHGFLSPSYKYIDAFVRFLRCTVSKTVCDNYTLIDQVVGKKMAVKKETMTAVWNYCQFKSHLKFLPLSDIYGNDLSLSY